MSEASCMLLSRFMKTEFVRKLTAEKHNKFNKRDAENYLPSNKMFIGITRNPLELLLDDGDINQEQYNQFLDTCRSFHDASFFYA